MREPEATTDDAAIAEQRAHVVRTSARRDVEVLGTAVQEEVTNAAADEIGLETGALEPPYDLCRVGVDAVLVERRVVALEAGRLVADGGRLVSATAIATQRVSRVVRSARTRALRRACGIRVRLAFSLDGERRELGRRG